MAPLDWSLCPALESIPGKRSGAWMFKDTRMSVATVFENLESGATVDEIMELFDVSREQVTAVLEFAARSLDARIRGPGRGEGAPVGNRKSVAWENNSNAFTSTDVFLEPMPSMLGGKGLPGPAC